MKRLNNQGIGHILVLVALVVIAGVGYVGWHIRQANSAVVSQVSSSHVAAPKTIHNTADLQKASAALDSASIDQSLDTTSLDSAENNLL